MSGMLSLFIFTGVFLTVFLLVLAVHQRFFASRVMVLQRLDNATTEVVTGREQASSPGMRVGLLRLMGHLGRAVPGMKNLKDTQANLIKARFFMKAEEFVGLTIVVGIFICLAIFLMTGSLLVGVIAGVLGLKLPGLLVDTRKKKISDAITRELPEALSIVTNGLRAGFSFPQALSVVCREMDGPLADEFSRVLRENQLGKPMGEALGDLQERTDNDDLNLMVSALLINRQVGGNLAEVLDNISHTIRERVRIKGEIQTLTAEGRISAVILSLLPVAVAGMIMVINPGYVSTLVQEPLGIIMIVLAIILQIIGIFVIRSMINLEV